MFSEPIKNVMERNKLVSAPPDTSVEAAARLMAERKVGAVLVVENKRLVGIITERDVVFRVVAADRNPRATRVAEVMTRDPKTLTPDETFGYAMLLMHENGFRHLPVVDRGEPIGVVSARSALDPELEEFEAEAQRRRSFRKGGVAA
jgi:CBS domain-containing protein